MRQWQFVLHQRALEEIDGLRAKDRRDVRASLLQLVVDPWQRPDALIRPANDRVYLVKDIGSIRITYWLDAFAREVFVVRVERP